MSMCAETNLPVFTFNERRYKKLSAILKVKIIRKELVVKYNSPEMIYKKAKIL
jgi:cell fate regulator YaaT (PSP1 superfamily)